jgi:microcystin-dependent protein
MAESFIGEIRMFAGNFAPLNWSFCDGSLIAISQNDTLFSLIGTTYGGDGQQTFALPDLRGRLPLHMGQGPGLSSRVIGELAGTESVTLTTQQMPAHTHQLLATNQAGNTGSPENQLLAASSPNDIYTTDLSSPAAMNPQAIGGIGGTQPHDNMMPYLAVNFIISLYGVYPQRA